MKSYPRTPEELVHYLKKFPVLSVRMPKGMVLYEFEGCDGLRMNFVKEDKSQIQIPLNSTLGNSKVEFNSDAFVRTIGRHSVWYYYIAKPWQADKPEWLRRAQDWDDVVLGMKNFGD